MKNAGTLFIVATPIGNLEDITLRALRILNEVDLIACEDTRVTGVLLKHFNIKKPMVSYFAHSKLSKIEYLISELESGNNIALVTDAGTPCISDPGVALIQKIQEETSNKKQVTSNFQNSNGHNSKQFSNLAIEQFEGIRIIPIPGPSALTTATSVSGMVEKEFYFAGFLPKKKGRQTYFRLLESLNCPIVVYESAMRLKRTLRDIKSYLGADTKVFIAREMTKMFEEYWGGKVDGVISDLLSHKLKGEIVLIIQKSKIKNQN